MADTSTADTSTPAESPLAGRRILITGATSGLGRALATKLATEHQVKVIAVGRRRERLDQLEAEISAQGGTAETHALSLTDRASVTQFCAALTTSGIDDLILNAGVTQVAPFTDGTQDADQNLIATNVTANLQLIRELVTPLSDNNTGGRVMLVASLGGLVPMPYQSVYAGSKAFLVNFGLSLREEFKARGICVLVFAPGGIATEMTDIDALSSMQHHLASAESVASEAIHMFINRRSLVVPGWQNKLIAFAGRLLPKPLMAALVERSYRKAVIHSKL